MGGKELIMVDNHRQPLVGLYYIVGRSSAEESRKNL